MRTIRNDNASSNNSFDSMPTYNGGNNKTPNINNSIKPVKVQRENPDINAQKNDIKDENEMMLYINNKHSLNN